MKLQEVFIGVRKNNLQKSLFKTVWHDLNKAIRGFSSHLCMTSLTKSGQMSRIGSASSIYRNGIHPR